MLFFECCKMKTPSTRRCPSVSPSPHPPSQQLPSTPPLLASAVPHAPPLASSNPCRLPYCDKSYSLRRGNLKATHWQEVAVAVLSRCPIAPPSPKTAVQCRHKMEKLRKRYHTELEPARSPPASVFVSSWVHFTRIDAMEKGCTAVKAEWDHEDEDEEDDDQV